MFFLPAFSKVLRDYQLLYFFTSFLVKRKDLRTYLGVQSLNKTRSKMVMFVNSKSKIYSVTFCKTPMLYEHFNDHLIICMKVNAQKTDLCLFYRGDTTPILITLNGKIIQSNRSINNLGVLFDPKL